MPNQQVIRFTDKLADTIGKLYRTGGFALAFGFAGIVMMLLARLVGQELSLWILLLGAILTFSCLGFFLYTTVIGHQKTVSALRDNKESIDTIQDISIDLIRLINTIQAHGFKNIEKLRQAMVVARPILEQMPLVGNKIKELDLATNSQWISSILVEKTEEIENLVKDIEDALIKADHKKLKQYSVKLENLLHLLRIHLK